jgi:hypothetical protein
MIFRNKKILALLLLAFVCVTIIYPLIVEVTHDHSDHSTEHSADCQCGCHGEMARCMCHTAAIGIVGFSYCNHEMNILFPLFTPFILNVLKEHEMEILRKCNSVNMSTNDQIKYQDVLNRIDHPPQILSFI